MFNKEGLFKNPTGRKPLAKNYNESFLLQLTAILVFILSLGTRIHSMKCWVSAKVKWQFFFSVKWRKKIDKKCDFRGTIRFLELNIHSPKYCLDFTRYFTIFF